MPLDGMVVEISHFTIIEVSVDFKYGFMQNLDAWRSKCHGRETER